MINDDRMLLSRGGGRGSIVAAARRGSIVAAARRVLQMMIADLHVLQARQIIKHSSVDVPQFNSRQIPKARSHTADSSRRRGV